MSAHEHDLPRTARRCRVPPSCSCSPGRASRTRTPAQRVSARCRGPAVRTTHDLHPDVAVPPAVGAFALRPAAERLRRVEALAAQLRVRGAREAHRREHARRGREARHLVRRLRAHVSSERRGGRARTDPELERVARVERLDGLLHERRVRGERASDVEREPGVRDVDVLAEGRGVSALGSAPRQAGHARRQTCRSCATRRSAPPVSPLSARCHHARAGPRRLRRCGPRRPRPPRPPRCRCSRARTGGGGGAC
jgi:hypothetical protein